MDPIAAATAGLQLANNIIVLITKVWDATPKESQAVITADFVRTAHNCSEFLNTVQLQINSVQAAVVHAVKVA